MQNVEIYVEIVEESFVLEHLVREEAEFFI